MGLRVAVLCGGSSPEREVSLVSGKSVHKALDAKGYNCKIYDLDKEFFKDIILKREIDVVFIALHGSPGEDGTVQGMLEIFDIPYTGSGVLSSSLAMSKHVSKSMLSAQGLKVAKNKHFCLSGIHGSKDGSRIEKPAILKEIKEFGFPLVIKPSNLGSSVGISIVENFNQIESAIEEASQDDCCILIEEFIEGREIQCGIIGRENPKPLPLIEIISKNSFFDYEAKYVPGIAEEISPAPLNQRKTEQGKQLAMQVFKLFGCRDLARVDMFLTNDGEYIISEVNTIPGLTPNSLLPKEAAAQGMSYEDLIETILLPAYKEAESKIENG